MAVLRFESQNFLKFIQKTKSEKRWEDGNEKVGLLNFS